MDWKTWAGQITTGHGATLLLSTAVAVGTGTLTWQKAVPVLIGGIVLILWPENQKSMTSSGEAQK